MILPLLLAYASMVAIQSKGPVIIGALWGPETQAAAEAQSVSDVQPDLAVDQLCGGYASAHFDTTSNILHAAGMLATVYLAVTLLVVAPLGLRSGNGAAWTLMQLGLWMLPVYYLPAWVGHLWFQKDIPAVFTYGTTLRGWAVGEYCAFVDLFSGGVVNEPLEELLPTAVLTWFLVLALEVMSTSPTGERKSGKDGTLKAKVT